MKGSSKGPGDRGRDMGLRNDGKILKWGGQVGAKGGGGKEKKKSNKGFECAPEKALRTLLG